MEEEGLRLLGKEAFQGFEEDDSSRAEWIAKSAFWLSLYMQEDYAENMSDDRSWGATESMPILTEACDQFQSRTYKTFFPNDSFVSAVPMRRTVEDRKELEDRAERIGRHMSYQLGFKDRSYKQDKDALFLGTSILGSFFTKAYYDVQEKRNKVDNIRPTDLVVNYKVGLYRIEDVRRKTQIIYTTVGETEDLVRSEYFLEAAKPGNITLDNNKYTLVVNQSTGTSTPETGSKRDRQAILLEQHVYLDLEETGEYLPYIITICATSQKVLRLTIGYEADQNGEPLDNYKQIQYYTHYKYAENPDGFYGLGLGQKIGDLNSAVNVMLRQSIDAATLANDGNMSGFISDRLGVNGDEISMTLGKFTKIVDTVGDMTNGIMMMKFPGPNAALLSIMELLDARAQRMGSTTEATTGATESVVQPTTYLAQIEQSLEQFSSVQTRLANSLSEELQKIYRLNRRYLPMIEYFVVNGTPETITRADYKDDMLIEPIFDPKFSTQAQKVARAKAELDATLQNPVNQSRPQVYDEAFKRYLEALEVEEIELLIPPAPQIENFDDQIIENMFFLMPKEGRPLFDVFPDQNHVQHLAILQEFLLTEAQNLQPDQLEDVLKHQQKHQGYLYGQIHGIIPPNDARQVPTPPLAGRPDNSMDTGAVGEEVSPMASQFTSEEFGGGSFEGGTTAGY